MIAPPERHALPKPPNAPAATPAAPDTPSETAAITVAVYQDAVVLETFSRIWLFFRWFLSNPARLFQRT